MAYTIIPDLPQGGPECGVPVRAPTDLLVLEQDVTRKITPLSFLSNSIAQLNITTNIKGSDAIPISDLGQTNTANLTIDNLMYYINTHLNVVDVVFFVSNLSGVDSLDFAERGRNEQLPFRTIKFAALQISKLIRDDINYVPTDPNFVEDITTKPTDIISKKVRKQYTIMVRSGDYVEENPVYLPPNTSMIGDNLRRTTIRPRYPQLDLFWVDSANYIWGFTFRDHKAPSAATAFPICEAVYQVAKDQGKPILSQYAPSNYTPIPSPPGIGAPNGSIGWVIDSYYNAYLTPLTDDTFLTSEPAIATEVVPKKRPFIYCSPYIQGCTSYAISDRMPNNKVGDNRNNPLYSDTWYLDDGDSTDPGVGTPVPYTPPPNNAGMGMRIDGSLVNGYFRSMVLDSYTQVNQGGKGIYILNHGYAQLVSIFTVSTEQGIVCEAGGTCSISTSNSTFGLSGLVATGMSYGEVLSGRFIIPSTIGYPISSESYANGNTNGVYGYSIGSNLFSVNSCTPIPVKYPYDDVYDIAATGKPMTVASQPYATLCFTVGDDVPWVSGYDEGIPKWSGPGYLMEEDFNPTVSRLQGDYSNFDGYVPSLSTVQMHQVKLFFIEQGVPTPCLSGGRLNPSDTNYTIYQNYGLSIPDDVDERPNVGLPWDIFLSFNISLDLQNNATQKAFDPSGNPMHFKINYKGNPEIINYTGLDVALNTPVPILSGYSTSQSTFDNTILNKNIKNGTIDFTNAPVKFYARSLIETGSHTFEYMGVGTRMKYAIPAFGGVADNANECASDGFNDKYNNAPGTVFFTSSNELGDFKVGKDFTIVQSTGTIKGETFSRAILTLVTPLTIVLE
jgi:hypothetical protein